MWHPFSEGRAKPVNPNPPPVQTSQDKEAARRLAHILKPFAAVKPQDIFFELSEAPAGELGLHQRIERGMEMAFASQPQQQRMHDKPVKVTVISLPGLAVDQATLDKIKGQLIPALNQKRPSTRGYEQDLNRATSRASRHALVMEHHDQDNVALVITGDVVGRLLDKSLAAPRKVSV